MNFKKVVVIVGPTASGKTHFSIWLAKKIKGTLINADSRNIFKDMVLGTDQPFKIDVPNFLFGFKSPRSFLSLHSWLKLATKIIHQTEKPIVVGGTWLWIKALVLGWNLPPIPPNFSLRQKLEKLDLKELQDKLYQLDPQRWLSLKENISNKRRVIRAIEIALTLGKVPPIHQEKKFDFLILGLKKPFNVLEREIEKRIKQALKMGLLEEIQKLRKKYHLSYRQLISFGNRYHWFSLYLLKKITLKEAILKTKKETLKYAKIQLKEFSKLNPYWLKTYLQGLKLTQKFFNQTT